MKALIVEDMGGWQNVLKNKLQQEGFNSIETADLLDSAGDFLRKGNFDLMILDDGIPISAEERDTFGTFLPKGGGSAFLLELINGEAKLPKIIIMNSDRWGNLAGIRDGLKGKVGDPQVETEGGFVEEYRIGETRILVCEKNTILGLDLVQLFGSES